MGKFFRNESIMKKQKTHGGARKGAGRKPTDRPTTTLAFRVPADKADTLKPKIKDLIKKHS